MEETGKKLQPGQSTEDRSYCQPCIQDGESVPAEAYCTVCKELLCSTCINAHRKLKITKTHVLLNKSEMPMSSLERPKYDDECTEPCDVHPKELIKYFCRNHQSLNCGHCVVQNHRSCRVDVIADISEAFKDGQGYGDIIKTIAEVLQAITDCASNVDNNIRLVAEMGEREVSKLRQYRDEVNIYFEKREKALLNSIEQMKNMDETLLDSLKPKYQVVQAKLQEINAHLETQENNSIQLFIEAKRVKPQLEGLRHTLATLVKENTIHQYEFRKDTVTERLLTSSTGLGTVECIVSQVSGLCDHEYADFEAIDHIDPSEFARCCPQKNRQCVSGY